MPGLNFLPGDPGGTNALSLLILFCLLIPDRQPQKTSVGASIARPLQKWQHKFIIKKVA